MEECIRPEMEVITVEGCTVMTSCHNDGPIELPELP